MAENFFGLTDVGKVRSNNEDTFIAQTVQQNRYVLAGVIDGVGGYEGGEIAAEITRMQMIEKLSESTADLPRAMINAFKAANEEIYARKQQNKALHSMACVATLAIADVQNNQFYYAHVGDTRLYLLRDQSLVKITKDHSFVGFLEDSGRLTEAAAMAHPKRNEINKALGFDHAILSEPDYIEVGHSPFLSGDMLLLCSDGLTDLVDKNEISRILVAATSLEQKSRQLIAAANSNGGKDNVTVVLVQNDKVALQQKATMPVIASKSADVAESKPAVSNPSMVDTSNMATLVGASKTNTGWIVFLALLSFIFAATAAWFYWQTTQHQTPSLTQQRQLTPSKNISARQKSLQDTINKLKGDTLLLTTAAFPQPILLNDTLNIDKDTLYIKTRGRIEFQRDTSYAGPAIALTAKCKRIIIDSIVLRGFTTGISSYNNALRLSGVQFINCLFPVQTIYTLPDSKPVSGSVKNVPYHADTLINISSKAHGSK